MACNCGKKKCNCCEKKKHCGCEVQLGVDCIHYEGKTLECIGAKEGKRLGVILEYINDKICAFKNVVIKGLNFTQEGDEGNVSLVKTEGDDGIVVMRTLKESDTILPKVDANHNITFEVKKDWFERKIKEVSDKISEAISNFKTKVFDVFKKEIEDSIDSLKEKDIAIERSIPNVLIEAKNYANDLVNGVKNSDITPLRRDINTLKTAAEKVEKTTYDNKMQSLDTEIARLRNDVASKISGSDVYNKVSIDRKIKEVDIRDEFTKLKKVVDTEKLDKEEFKRILGDIEVKFTAIKNNYYNKSQVDTKLNDLRNAKFGSLEIARLVQLERQNIALDNNIKNLKSALQLLKDKVDANIP